MNTNLDVNKFRAEVENKELADVINFQAELDIAMNSSKSSWVELSNEIFRKKLEYNKRSNRLEKSIAGSKEKIIAELIARDGRYYRSEEVEMKLLQHEKLQEALLMRAQMKAEIEMLEQKLKIYMA